MGHSDLFSDFQEVSAKAWKQRIQMDLQGADYNAQMIWESPEGIKVKPFYHSEDLHDLHLTPTPKTASWKVGQAIYAGKTGPARKKAIEALANGVESLFFTVPDPEVAVKELLQGIDLNKTEIHFKLPNASPNTVAAILDIPGLPPHNPFLHLDIIGHLAQEGNWYTSMPQDFKDLEALCNLGHPHSLSVNLALYENAGANKIQQLAYSLAHAHEYLHHLEQRNKAALQNMKISFQVSVGSDYFFEIAKIRALRLLYGNLASTYGMSPECHIVGTPTKRNKTLYDYNNNLLRTTTECMSAILGGANTLINLPYDAVHRKENAFGTRIARNQLLLLQQESHFGAVSNPTDGTYYIESLTQQLATKALELFKQIEKSGGILVQLKQHLLQRKIKESALKEQKRFDQGELVLVGANKFQQDGEKIKDQLQRYPFVRTQARKTLIEPIIEKRLSEAWEQKRLQQE